jgi:hypothetical protein
MNQLYLFWGKYAKVSAWKHGLSDGWQKKYSTKKDRNWQE